MTEPAHKDPVTKTHVSKEDLNEGLLTSSRVRQALASDVAETPAPQPPLVKVASEIAVKPIDAEGQKHIASFETAFPGVAGILLGIAYAVGQGWVRAKIDFGTGDGSKLVIQAQQGTNDATIVIESA